MAVVIREKLELLKPPTVYSKWEIGVEADLYCDKVIETPSPPYIGINSEE